MGLEPTTFGITIRRSNQLSYTYRVGYWSHKSRGRQRICKRLADFFHQLNHALI